MLKRHTRTERKQESGSSFMPFLLLAWTPQLRACRLMQARRGCTEQPAPHAMPSDPGTAGRASSASGDVCTPPSHTSAGRALGGAGGSDCCRSNRSERPWAVPRQPRTLTSGKLWAIFSCSLSSTALSISSLFLSDI